MVEDITSDEVEEEEFRPFPKEDRTKIYAISLILLIAVSVYISIIIDKIWISVFIVVPILSISQKAEVSQEKFNLQKYVSNLLWKLWRIVSISVLVGTTIYLMIEFGILISSILVIISFSIYCYFSGLITRKNVENSNKIRSEVQ